MNLSVPAPVSGGLILSYQCNASCRHCMYGCGPRWSGDWIAPDDLRATLDQLARYIEPSPMGPDRMSLSHGLHFTGGEPFLNFELLCLAVEEAHRRSIPSKFVETNAFWCRDESSIREKLQTLRDVGLGGIKISVNPFYLEYIPFERTERCLRAALEVFGPNVAVYQIDYYRRFKQRGYRDRVSLEQQLADETPQTLFRHVEFFLSGRAPYALGRLPESFRRMFARYQPDRLCREPCVPEFVRPWHNHFDNYGNYMPGFCGGIRYGDCRRLDELVERPIDAEAFPVLALLMREDLAGLLEMARGLGFEPDPGGYYSRCHLCSEVRRFLAGLGRFDELAPAEFYDHLADDGPGGSE